VYKKTTDEEKKTVMIGDKHGGMVDVLLSALETNGNPRSDSTKQQRSPHFPMFVCEN
jgi:hypothetical protein